MASRPKTWIVNAGLVLLSVGLSLIFAEWFVRSHYQDKFGRKPLFLVPDYQAGYSIAPNLDDTFHAADFQIHVRSDSFGARLGRRGSPGWGDSLVILVGDSYTFGWGVDDGETFASHLDDLLETHAPSLRVVNLGVGGYGTLASAARLDRFLAGSTKPIAAIVVMHSHNDMGDNVNDALRRSGFSTPEIDPAFRPLSRSQLVNFIEFIAMAETATVTPKRDTDELFELQWMRSDKIDGMLEVGPVRVPFSSIDLTQETSSKTIERGHMSQLQTDLMLHSLRELSCKRPGVKVLHTVIHFAPPWYTAEIERLLQSIQDCPADVRFTGAMEMKIPPPHFNAHSGGHLTSRANRSYAEQLLQRLRDAGVVESAK